MEASASDIVPEATMVDLDLDPSPPEGDSDEEAEDTEDMPQRAEACAEGNECFYQA